MKLYRAHTSAVILPLLRTPSYWVPLVSIPTLLYYIVRRSKLGFPLAEPGAPQALPSKFHIASAPRIGLKTS